MKKMKSTVALVLALIMAFSAFTCASAAPRPHRTMRR